MGTFPESDRRGSFTLTVFALGWTAAGSGAVPSALGWSAIGASVVAAVAVVHRAQRASRNAAVAPPAAMRRFGWVNLAQALTIAVVVAVLVTVDAARFVPAAVCTVVAMHFVPLAEVFGQRRYLRLAAALGSVAIVGFALAPFEPRWSLGVVGFGAAAALLATAWQLAGSRAAGDVGSDPVGAPSGVDRRGRSRAR